MIRLAIRTLRHRKGAFVAAFLTMFLGAAIVMACGALLETGIRTTVPPQQLADADVVVAGDQLFEIPKMDYTAVMPERARIDAALVDTIGALPGVREAGGHVFDHPAPEGTVDAIGVVAEAGTSADELRELIDAELPATVVTYVGDDRGLAELPEAMIGGEGLVVLSSIFGSWAILIAIFGVASMLALSIQQRHRELALLRAVGSTPGQLRKLVLGETMVLAALATGLAILPGRWLGEYLLHELVRNGVVTDGLKFYMGWIPTTIAIAAAVLAAIGGALVAGGRAAGTKPTEALADAGLPARRRMGVWRILLGLALLAGGVSLLVVTMTVNSGKLASATGSPGAIVMAIAVATLSPLLVRPLAALLSPLGALTGQSGRLAMLNVRAGIDRTAAVAMPVILLTGIATGLLYMHSTGKNAVHEEYVDSLAADAVVRAEDEVDSQLAEQISALSGVDNASPYVRSQGFVEQPIDDPAQWSEGTDRWAGWTVEGTTPDGAGAVVPHPVAEGTLDDLHGATAAMDAGNAAELGVALGDLITVRMGDNSSLEVEVVALFDHPDDNDTLLMPADVVAAHTTTGRVTELLVVGDGSISVEQMVAAIAESLAGDNGLKVADRAVLAAEMAEDQDTEAFAIYTIVIMIVTYTAISVINALASSTNARRREFGLQRLTGSTRGQVLRMLITESLVVAVIGVLLGTISAVATLMSFSIGRADTLHSTGSPLVYIGIVVLAVLLTLSATLVPGWRALRRKPIEAAVSP